MKDTQLVRVRLGQFELDLRTGELRSSDATTLLREQPLQVLRLLVEAEGELVGREEIRRRLWPNDTIVEFDHSINTAIKNLRRALGDSADEPKYIETLARRGYRLMVPVERFTTPDDSSVGVNAAGAETAVRLQSESGIIGRKVSHYRVLEVIGGGGMGLVYKAEDLKLGRQVALKFLPEELATDPAALQRFEREAQTASSLNHPNICTIHEVEEHDAEPFIVMELLEGETLRDRLATIVALKKTLPPDELLDIAVQICCGLEAAHAKGIIHRDIKPANIFITNSGQVKILDFGLAKALVGEQPFDLSSRPERGAAATSAADGPVVGGALEKAGPSTARPPVPQKTRDGEEGGHFAQDDNRSVVNGVLQGASLGSRSPDPTLTRFGSALGTAGYMSPEQVRGEKLDARTDIFSFGLVLYEMATGHRAFGSETQAVLQEAILTDNPVPARDLNSTLPPKLSQLIDKALEKDRDRRYQSAAEVRADLEQVQLRQPFIAPEASASGRWKWFTVATLAVVLAAAIAGALYWRWRAPKKLTDKDTIVVADFENHTNDQVFDYTLKTALTVALNQSPFLNVLSESRVAAALKLMVRPAGAPLTPEITRDVCQRTDSTAYIAGSIANLGSEYVIGLKAVNCQSGDTLAQEQVTAEGKERVLNAVGDAAAKLRSHLGESLATVQKFDVPMVQATTSSLEALQAYSLGIKLHSDGKPEASLAFFQRAIQLDPNFAMAYAALGSSYRTLEQVGRAGECYKKAFELSARASDRERLIITVVYYFIGTGELDKAAQGEQEMIAEYPRDPYPLYNLANIYSEQGRYQEALGAIRQWQQLDRPGSLRSGYGNTANSLLALQRLDEAWKPLEEARARKVDNIVVHDALYGLAFLAGDARGMAEQQQWFAAHPALESSRLSLASDTEAYAGRLGKARELTKRAVDSAIRADSKENGAIWLENAAIREAALGNINEAKQSAADGLKLSPSSWDVQIEAALAFAMAGEDARAQSIAEAINKDYPVNTQVQSLWLPAVRAQIALNRENPAEAVSNLQAALPPIEYGLVPFVPNISCLYPTYIRGQAYLAAGQGKEAAVEFQKILDHSGIVWNCWTGALAQLGVARANALQAKNSTGADADAAHTRALAAYQDFLALWKDADPDIPVYKQAKAEYAKLQ